MKKTKKENILQRKLDKYFQELKFENENFSSSANS
jgi:hypothetical protein